MGTIISYFTSLLERENTSTADQNQATPSESSSKYDISVTKPAQTLVSVVQEESGPAQPTVNSHSVHPQIPSQYYQNYPADPDQIAEVDKINLYVKCAAKILDVDMFPMERISVLLEEACERAGKKPEKMSLIFEGEPMDVNKTVHEYRLRGGSMVNLINV